MGSGGYVLRLNNLSTLSIHRYNSDTKTHLLPSGILQSVKGDECITHNKLIRVQRKWLNAQRSGYIFRQK